MEKVVKIPKNLMPQVEMGDAVVSIQNVIKEIHMNGPIFGVIHRIPPFGDHSTLIFHMNGYVWEAIGFHLGQITKENIHNAVGLAWVLNMIPFLSPFIQGSYLKEKASKKELAEYEENMVCVNYVWRPPVGKLIPLDFSSCDGSLTMDKYIQEASEDVHSLIKEEFFDAD